MSIITTNPALEHERRVKQLVRDLDLLVRTGLRDLGEDDDDLSGEAKAILSVLANVFAGVHLKVEPVPRLDGQLEQRIGLVGPAEIVTLGAEMTRRERPEAAAVGQTPPIHIH